MNKVFLFGAFFCSVLSGCIGDNYEKPQQVQDPIVFRGQINNSTRAQGTSWDADDEIGIFMVPTGGEVGDGCLADNVKHVHEGGGEFTVGDGHDALFFPKDGEAVDFVAYYPYSDALDDYKYAIDVSDQSNHAAIDVLYSDNATNLQSGKPTLQFDHALTRLIFNVKGTSEEVDLAGLQSAMVGLPTLGEFDLSDGSVSIVGGGDPMTMLPVTVQNGEDGQMAVVEAIVLPANNLNLQLMLVFADDEVAVFDLTGVSYGAGNAYTYNLSVDEQAKVVVLDGLQIDDWESVNRGDHDVSKGKLEVFYKETFGEANLVVGAKPSLSEFTGWSSGWAGVTYTNQGDADVRVKSLMSAPNNPFMAFPESGTSDVVISGLSMADYSGIEFTCMLACGQGQEPIDNPVQIWVSKGSPESMTEVVVFPYEQLNTTLHSFGASIPVGTTTIRITSSGAEVYVDEIMFKGIRKQ